LDDAERERSAAAEANLLARLAASSDHVLLLSATNRALEVELAAARAYYYR
jgi:hypothetical protein